MIKLAVIAPFWKRDMTTLLFFQHMAIHRRVAATQQIRMQLFAVGSEEHSAEMTGGHRFVEAPNQPLGAKFNAGYAAAEKWEPDYAMTMGSDTFFSPRTWEVIRAGIDNGYDSFGFLDLYMYEIETRTGIYWSGYKGARQGEPIGPLRTTKANVLDDLNWGPYDYRRSRNLDISMIESMRELDPPVKPVGLHGGSSCMIVSLKEPDSITDMSLFKDVARVPTGDIMELLAQFV